MILTPPHPWLHFATLAPQPPDALLALIARHRDDPRPDKIDLGVGVFRDESGATPVMRAVKAAERLLLADQKTKAYLGADGDIEFTRMLASVVLGTALDPERSFGIQTPGGTGALRLGAELIARANPDATVWIGIPTWPNHLQIFAEAGLKVRAHRYFDGAGVDLTAMIEDIAAAKAGDVLLLHGCAHNPTGTGFDAADWRAIGASIERQGLLPLIDLAYQGLGDGLEEDAAGLRFIFDTVPAAILACSCNKNFALYRERVGALWVQAARASDIGPVRDTMLGLARSLWSMPPDHGAAIVRIILGTPALRLDWESELGAMRARINRIRTSLAAAHPRFSTIAHQRGLFAMLPLEDGSAAALRQRSGIYLADSGRINVAGLRNDEIPRFVSEIEPYLRA